MPSPKMSLPSTTAGELTVGSLRSVERVQAGSTTFLGLIGNPIMLGLLRAPSPEKTTVSPDGTGEAM